MTRNKKLDQMNQDVDETTRQNNISEGLSEIYQDDVGDIIDVKRLDIKPTRDWKSLLVTIALYIIGVSILAGLAWYWFNRGADATAVELSVEAYRGIVAGQEFTYTIKYDNQDKVALNKASLHVDYPENFIFVSSEPAPGTNNNEWQLNNIAAHSGGQIVIKGKIVNEVGKSNVAVAELTYEPANFSSSFKKTATLDTAVESMGLEITTVNDASSLVGEKQTISFKYKLKEDGQLKHFWLRVEPSEISDVEFINDSVASTASTTSGLTGNKLIKPWLWEIVEAKNIEQEIKINFKFIDKTKLTHSFNFILETKEEVASSTTNSSSDIASSTTSTTTIDIIKPPKTYIFYQNNVAVEVVKNDLNLSLVINQSDKDQGVNFGQVLNYSLSYANKGQKTLEDVVIMAVIEGDAIDWNSLKDLNKGKHSGNNLIWTKEEIPELASLASDATGIIDWSLQIKERAKITNKNFNNEIKSYTQFSHKQFVAKVNDGTASSTDNQSNTIINKINSDLDFSEKLIYFNEDSIPVGSGPLPFTALEATVVRGEWKILNSFHELNTVLVSMKLPDYVNWTNKTQANSGDLSYDSASRTLTWKFNVLPASPDEIKVSFDLSVEPKSAQSRQILVIMPAAKITAIDSMTNNQISKEGRVKTSKLEDDPLIKSGDMDINGGQVK
jgi:hypothetical protein